MPWEFFCTGSRNSGFWTTIPVPSCWELQGFGTYNYGHDAGQASEQGIYRRSFSVPSDWASQKVDIVFEGVMTDAAVEVNGLPAGPAHQGAFYQFRYDITSLVQFGATNTVQVTVSKKSANTSINQAEREADYWIFGGIYRPVYLEARPAESIRRMALNPQADGTLQGKVTIHPPTAAAVLDIRVFTLQGAEVGALSPIPVTEGQATVTFAGSIPGVSAWTMENPVLYDVVATLTRNAVPLHAESVRTGFRTISVTPGVGLFLNGVKIRLKGVNRHTFWPDSGRTSSQEITEADVALIRGMNMNAVRMSHYPPDQHFLDECDRVGLLVIDELAGWQAPPYDNATAARLVREMVERDVNHPSIILWANGNEGGFNLTVIGDYATHDPQGRPVIHPSSNYAGSLTQGGFDTTHYPTYATLVSKLSGPNLYLPTELLHGLYDGGHAAGLQDYWDAIRASSKGVGGFLWVLADEGVVRTDQGGFVDTDGNHAPDGIVGPYAQKEPSHDAIRDIWSPVAVPVAPVLSSGFTGQIGLLNDYHFTDLAQCTFRWETLDFPLLASTEESSSKVIDTGSLAGPPTPPQATGNLNIPMPADWLDRGALRLTALDPKGREIRSWVWPIRTGAALLADNLPTGEGEAALSQDSGSYFMGWETTRVSISKSTGLLQTMQRDGIPVPLTNGPRMASGSGTFSSASTRMEGSVAVVEALFDGNLQQLMYRLHPGGALEIAYAFQLTGTHAHIGLTFDCQGESIKGLRWIGDGPQPVWKNRAAGVGLGIWRKTTNAAIPGQVWTEDPVFPGYHSGLRWAMFEGESSSWSLLTDMPGMFLRVLTPSMGSSPQNATFTVPPGDISVLHAISAHGNKFHAATNTGPAGASTTAAGPYAGRFFLLPTGEVLEPAVVSVEPEARSKIRVRFNRSMGSGAFDPVSYSLSPSLAIHSATPETASVVLLDVQPLEDGVPYTLSVASGLQAADGDAMLPSGGWPVAWSENLVVEHGFETLVAGQYPDTSGNGRNASPAGSVTLQDGYRGKALSLPVAGSGSASFEMPSLQEYSITGWFFLTKPAASSYPRILSLNNDTVRLFLDATSTMRSIGFAANGRGDWRTPVGSMPDTGRWVHFSVNFGPAGAPSIAIDGVPLAVAAGVVPTGNAETAGIAYWGNRNDGTRPFEGLLDELRIRSRLVSAAEVATHAAQGPTQTYTEWMAGYPGAEGGPSEDPDADGYANGIEQLAGGVPTTPEPKPLSRLEPTAEALRFFFLLSDTAEGVSAVVEWSPSLASASWQPLSPFIPWRVHTAAVEYMVELPYSIAPGAFVRLRADP